MPAAMCICNCCYYRLKWEWRGLGMRAPNKGSRHRFAFVFFGVCSVRCGRKRGVLERAVCFTV